MIGENTINLHLSEILDEMSPDWDVAGEDYNRFEGSTARADILVTGRFPPIVIETEFEPADTLRDDALSKLGSRLRNRSESVEAVFAVRLPNSLRERRGRIVDAVRAVEFEFAVHTAGGRFPADGWIRGDYYNLYTYVRAATTISEKIEEHAGLVHGAIRRAATHISELRGDDHFRISKALRQEPGEQTWRMAGLVLANAVIFYEAIAGQRGIRRLDQDDFNKSIVLDAWTHVLKINYVPIFSIAIDVLRNMDSATAKTILAEMHKGVEKLHADGLESSPDLAGALIQRTISDRKKLAAFYTLPPVAAMLAALLVPRGVEIWQGEWHKSLRVGDFACGTGTLLAAVYRQMIANSEAHGHLAQPHHKEVMGRVLVGRDVLPVSVHLAVAALSSVYAHDIIDKTNILSMPFGKTDAASGTIQYGVGSLDLMVEQTRLDPSHSIMVGGKGVESKEAGTLRGTFSMVVMNPPFVRSTNHAGDGRDKDHAPAFAAFGATPQDQIAMKSKAGKLLKNTCYDGDAGMGSAFAAVGDRMLAPGGALGLILPATVTAGYSWKKLRNMLNHYYQDVVVFTTADIGSSFSADTSMWEAIIVCRKRADADAIRYTEQKIEKLRSRLARERKGKKAAAKVTAHRLDAELDKMPKSRGRFVTLLKGPSTVLEALALADIVRETRDARRLESDAYGSTSLTVGEDVVGRMLDCPLHRGMWECGNVWDMTLLQSVEHLRRGTLRLRSGNAVNIPMTKMGDLADLGWLHRDITEGSGKNPRGPFKQVNIAPDKRPDYQALWCNNFETQVAMVVEPDCGLEAKAGSVTLTDEERRAADEKLAGRWSKAGHLHVNRDVGYFAQKICFGYTNDRVLSGPAWETALPRDNRHEKALCVWGNSTLGILCYWGTVSKQQPGRGRHSRDGIMDLPVLNMAALSATQLDKMDGIFDRYCKKEMRPIALLDRCDVRQAMDEEMMAVLGINDIDLSGLRKRLCDEPSVHGGRTIERSVPMGESILHVVRRRGKGMALFATERRVLVQDDARIRSFEYDQIVNVELRLVENDGASKGKKTVTSTLTFTVSGLDGGLETGVLSIVGMPKSRLASKPRRTSKAKQPKIDVFYEYVREMSGLG